MQSQSTVEFADTDHQTGEAIRLSVVIGAVSHLQTNWF